MSWALRQTTTARKATFGICNKGRNACCHGLPQCSGRLVAQFVCFHYSLRRNWPVYQDWLISSLDIGPVTPLVIGPELHRRSGQNRITVPARTASPFRPERCRRFSLAASSSVEFCTAKLQKRGYAPRPRRGSPVPRARVIAPCPSMGASASATPLSPFGAS
jgi:hypothetical protein